MRAIATPSLPCLASVSRAGRAQGSHRQVRRSHPPTINLTIARDLIPAPLPPESSAVGGRLPCSGALQWHIGAKFRGENVDDELPKGIAADLMAIYMPALISIPVCLIWL